MVHNCIRGILLYITVYNILLLNMLNISKMITPSSTLHKHRVIKDHFHVDKFQQNHKNCTTLW